MMTMYLSQRVIPLLTITMISLSLLPAQTTGIPATRTFLTPWSTDNKLRLPITEIREFCDGTPLLTQYGQPISRQHVTVQAVAQTDQYSSCSQQSTALASITMTVVSTYLKACYKSIECNSKSYIKEDLGYECSNEEEAQNFNDELRLKITIYCSPENPPPSTATPSPVTKRTRMTTPDGNTSTRAEPGPPVFPETTEYFIRTTDEVERTVITVTGSTLGQNGEGGDSQDIKKQLFEYKEAMIIMIVVIVVVIAISVSVIIYFIKCRGVVLLQRKSSQSSRDSGPPSRQALYSRVSLGSKDRYDNNKLQDHKLNKADENEYTMPDDYATYEIPDEEDDTYETVNIEQLKRPTNLSNKTRNLPPVPEYDRVQITSISSPMYGAGTPGAEYMIPIISQNSGDGGDDLPSHRDIYTEGYLVPVTSVSKSDAK